MTFADNLVRLLLEDPGLTKRSHRPLLARVRKLFADNPDIFN